MTNKYYAFFDVDGTIVNIKTMFKFLNFCYENNIINRNNYKTIFFKIMKKICFNRAMLNRAYYKLFESIDETELVSIGYKWFDDLVKKEDIFIHSIIQELEIHKKNNAEIVLVSGSFRPCIQPLADCLSVDHMLLTGLEIKNKKYTGKLLGKPNIGKGKADSIKEFMKNQREVNLNDCYAYGDHHSDFPMLKLVGFPYLIGRDEKIIRIAKV